MGQFPYCVCVSEACMPCSLERGNPEKAWPAELTSSLTLVAGDWSLALLLMWLLLPFSKSRRDLSFSASNS